MKIKLAIIVISIGVTAMFGNIFAKEKTTKENKQDRIPILLNLKDWSVNGIKPGDSLNALKALPPSTSKDPSVREYKASGLYFELDEDDREKIYSIEIMVQNSETNAPRLSPADLTVIMPDGTRSKVTDISTLRIEATQPGIQKKIRFKKEDYTETLYTFGRYQMVIMADPVFQLIQLEEIEK